MTERLHLSTGSVHTMCCSPELASASSSQQQAQTKGRIKAPKSTAQTPRPHLRLPSTHSQTVIQAALMTAQFPAETRCCSQYCLPRACVPGWTCCLQLTDASPASDFPAPAPGTEPATFGIALIFTVSRERAHNSLRHRK